MRLDLALSGDLLCLVDREVRERVADRQAGSHAMSQRHSRADADEEDASLRHLTLPRTRIFDELLRLWSLALHTGRWYETRLK